MLELVFLLPVFGFVKRIKNHSCILIPHRLPRPGIAGPLVALGGSGEVFRQPGDHDRGRGGGTIDYQEETSQAAVSLGL